MLPLGPPDGAGSPYMPHVGVRRLAGLLAEPDGAGERRRRSRRFASAIATGSRTGSGFAGDGRCEDQVRFEREWGALRAYAAGTRACA